MNSDIKNMGKELGFLVGQGEGYNLEFKESYSKNIAKDICAFANANGGRILIGVSDSGEVKGVQITNSLKSEIHDLARNFDPPLNIALEPLENILIINVPEGVSKPYSTGGKFYLRYGTNSQQLGRDEIRGFFQKEGLVLFDEKPNFDFVLENDFDDATFKTFLKLSNISPVLGRSEILENLFLLKDGHVKNAGVLLFCQRVTKFFGQATITCVLYQGKTKYKILDRKEFDSDLYSNFQNAFLYLQSKLNTEFIIKGGPRVERLELPEEALREALLNAVAHRDYFVSGANILVEVFSDRVEITNPGGLVRGLSKKDLGKKSLSRNNLLFGLLQRMGLVEKVGSGIMRMKKAMKDYGFRGPIFDISENWFTIVFKRPAATTQKTTLKTPLITPQKTPLKGLTELEQKILDEIAMNPTFSRREIADALEISEHTVKEYLERLKGKGVLKRVGSARGGYWEVLDKR